MYTYRFMLENFPLFRIHRVAGYGGFVCIDISSCYHKLAALMLIFTFLSTLLKYMVVDVLWGYALAEQRFTSYENVREWLDNWFDLKDEQFYWRGIHHPPEKWEKYVNSNRDYFE